MLNLKQIFLYPNVYTKYYQNKNVVSNRYIQSIDWTNTNIEFNFAKCRIVQGFKTLKVGGARNK